MASIIRIKRSLVSGNPATLAAGELAYSGLQDNGSNGGDRLYIGMGTETAGNAANHVVIGGKYFTDRLDHTAGVLTANSALVVDANSKLDNFLVDNLQLNGSTLSTTNLNGDLFITPDGTGKTVISNLYIGDTSTSLAEYIQDQNSASLAAGLGIDIVYDDGTGTSTISAELASSSNAGVASFDATDFSVTGTGENAVTLNVERIQDIVGGMVSTNTESGISVTYDDTNGKLDFDVNDPTITIAGDVDGSATMTNLGSTTITVTLDTVNSNVGTFGSSTAIPVLTVNGKGLVTAVSTASISTTLGIAGNTGTDSVALGTDTLTFTGTGAIVTAVTNNTLTISAVDATSSTKGVASFGTSDFNVSSGAVSLVGSVVKSVTTDSGALTPSSNAFSILGGEGIDVTHSGTTITVAGELATTSNIGVASFSSASFDVTAGAVTIKAGGVSNSQLVNSSLTIGSTTVSLGGTSTTLAGLTQLDVDNIRIDGNEISSTDTNGNISLNPNGTGSVNVNSARITSLADPVDPTDAATKQYVDSRAAGLDPKESVRVATTGPITLSGTQTIDGVALSVGNRVLVKDQVDTTTNGVYVVASGAWTRATDFDQPSEITAGVHFFVEEGTSYADTGWVISSASVGTVGSDPVTFVQFSSAGQIVAGDGLSKTGNTLSVNVANGLEISGDNVQLASSVAGNGLTYTSGVLAVGGTADRISVSSDSIDIAATYVGQTSITTLGTITTGTWNGTAIGTVYGGTGLTSYATGDLIYASGTNTLAKLAAGADGKVLQMNSSGVPVWGDIDGGTY